MSEFKLTSKQLEAQQLFASDATHICLFGGSRSGKTFLTVRNIVMRALKAERSRHGIFRLRFNAIKQSIMLDTFPKVMQLAFPGVEYDLNKTDFYACLPNMSEIWFAGLDDKERTEKVLGKEFVTIYLNECSQIPLDSVNKVKTRLAQKCEQTIEGSALNATELKPRCYYDLNPPTKGHWSYKTFIKKIDIETGKPVDNPNDYAAMQMNPIDNVENISSGYLQLLEALPARDRIRFKEGNFGEENPNALFTDVIIDTWRENSTPQLIRVVVAVDPSGASDDESQNNDAIGIVVAGLGIDGNAYVLEDCTVKASPKVWGNVATTAYDRHSANVIVAEKNFGGAMVEFVIKAANPSATFREVTASRGKSVRAEPVSALYEQGKIRHVGRFIELEEELCNFSIIGYMGAKSPNRADALIWAITELFPRLSTSREAKTIIDYSHLDLAIV